ncbi:DUF2924 domain-containing protein [Brevundimonas huaxiensis]|uniref:DUF2924 domain-containing protein n=1 Tax=Brevundimonas huaxiensis TaxID=2725493 RepID=UPI00196535C1|nr:DUF2924 domain-containing protein [Brevundimonas huaxiensis]DAQ80052.1 MAG TPA: Protein of unknown function (DUF2924) [Caudoviricetes sp.]
MIKFKVVFDTVVVDFVEYSSIGSAMSDIAADTTNRLADLAGIGLADLREEWRKNFGAPPKLRSPELLGLMLAYRLQAAAEGGMDVDLRRTLRRPSAGKTSSVLTPGTKLAREWQGIRHEVTVEPDGRVRWQGQDYRSLSEVARAITGARWNGPRFFGLRAAQP